MATTSPENQALLEAFSDLRVADVRDALDVLGLHFKGSMVANVRPLWRTRAFGIARTVRYVPYAGTIPTMTPEQYAKWSGYYYGTICTYPWVKEIEPGDFMVIDQSSVDAGLMGSENTMACLRSGLRGFASNGGVRDTDEVIMQQVPFWSVFISQKMVQGRLQYESRNVPVEVGGVTVVPGDVVVADGDGVIVVPRARATEVARLAHEEHERDKAARRKHYEALGRKPDATV